MRKLNLFNLALKPADVNFKFAFENYTFTQTAQTNNNKCIQNGYVTFQGTQLDSILFLNGIIKRGPNQRKMKFLEDLLILGRLITGYNLAMNKNLNSFPLISKPYLQNIIEPILKQTHMEFGRTGSTDIIEERNKLLNLTCTDKLNSFFSSAVKMLRDKSWQNKFENGYHLRMLVNRANIVQHEARFISNMSLWEWLYFHLNSEADDTQRIGLDEITRYILNYVFSSQVDLNEGNILPVLRNQLAHSGKIPINRPYAKPWMTELQTWSQLGPYIFLFDKLTQIIVLKTLGIDAKYIEPKLDHFMETGKLE